MYKQVSFSLHNRAYTITTNLPVFQLKLIDQYFNLKIILKNFNVTHPTGCPYIVFMNISIHRFYFYNFHPYLNIYV